MGISTPDERKEFVKRLKKACDNNSNIPPERMGRQSAIASTLGVVPEAVSRWFAGETMPNNARARDLAKLVGVDVGWLILGHGDASPTARDSSLRRLSASAMLVRALLSLHGMTVADLPESDPKSSIVSFYVVMDGRLVPIIVVTGTPGEKGEFTTIVPANFEAGTVICVIPRGMNPILLLLSTPAIRRNKRATNNGVVLTILDTGTGGLYKLGGKQVTRIRNFSVLATSPDEATV